MFFYEEFLISKPFFQQLHGIDVTTSFRWQSSDSGDGISSDGCPQEVVFVDEQKVFIFVYNFLEKLPEVLPLVALPAELN